MDVLLKVTNLYYKFTYYLNWRLFSFTATLAGF
jgi:hypothetical protein